MGHMWGIIGKSYFMSLGRARAPATHVPRPRGKESGECAYGAPPGARPAGGLGVDGARAVFSCVCGVCIWAGRCAGQRPARQPT